MPQTEITVPEVGSHTEAAAQTATGTVPHEAASEGQAPEQEQSDTTTQTEEVFDFAAVRARFPTLESRGRLTQTEEVGLAQLIHAGKAAKAALAESAAAEEPPDSATISALEAHVHAGDDALEVFVIANQGMIKQITNGVRARFWHMPRLELEDLEQDATRILIGAVEKFDPERGVSFSSYAYRTIERDLANCVRDTGNLIRTPRSTVDKMTHARKLVNDGQSLEKAAASIRYSAATVLASEQALLRPDAVSYDITITPDGDSPTPLIDLLDIKAEDTPFTEKIEDRLSAEVATSALRSWMSERAKGVPAQAGTDPDRAYKVLLAHYAYGMPVNDIADKLGVTRQCTAQIIARTVETITTKLPSEISGQIETAGYTVPGDRTKH